MFTKMTNDKASISNFENISQDGKVFGGREITKIQGAKRDFFDKKIDLIDPRPYIEKGVLEKKSFFGFHHNGDNEGEPIYISNDDITMQLFCGATGTGKGVFAGNIAYEHIVRGKGLILIDPKMDNFLPQVIKEACDKYGRYFSVAYWPSNFGYSGINEDDDYLSISNKLISALGIDESDNPGVEYYRGNERSALKKILKIFFNGALGVIVKKDFKEITKNLQYLKTDLEKAKKWDIENAKMRPNIDILSKLEGRYFNTDLVNKIYWSEGDISAIDSLSNKLSEISQDSNIYNGVDMEKICYEGGVLILKTDLLDPASLKMTKMLFGDLLLRGRKKKCNLHVLTDEASFYATKLLSGSLAVKRGLGITYSIFIQELKQLSDEVRDPIMSNCNIKGFYKTSNLDTLNYISEVSGKVPATSISSNKEKGLTFGQVLEDNINVTMMRALPRVQVMVLVAECLNTTIVARTNFIPTEGVFDWSEWEFRNSKSIDEKLKDIEKNSLDIEKINFKTTLDKKIELLEDSELFGFSFKTEKIN